MGCTGCGRWRITRRWMTASRSWNSACPANDNHRLWSHNLGSRHPPQNHRYTVRRAAVRPTFRNYWLRPLATLLPQALCAPKPASNRVFGRLGPPCEDGGNGSHEPVLEAGYVCLSAGLQPANDRLAMLVTGWVTFRWKPGSVLDSTQYSGDSCP